MSKHMGKILERKGTERRLLKEAEFKKIEREEIIGIYKKGKKLKDKVTGKEVVVEDGTRTFILYKAT